mmetsp:Transcript_8789/g.31692  ORF Transcript_8789/g.31692 Transcript_8789/m.31692 type:complete len:269 (-) Transcript_8789:626-1432(-)
MLTTRSHPGKSRPRVAASEATSTRTFPSENLRITSLFLSLPILLVSTAVVIVPVCSLAAVWASWLPKLWKTITLDAERALMHRRHVSALRSRREGTKQWSRLGDSSGSGGRGDGGDDDRESATTSSASAISLPRGEASSSPAAPEDTLRCCPPPVTHPLASKTLADCLLIVAEHKTLLCPSHFLPQCLSRSSISPAYVGCRSLSASSSTRSLHEWVWRFPLLLRSASLPGVPTTIFGMLAFMAATCRLLFAPPMHWHTMLRLSSPKTA